MFFVQSCEKLTHVFLNFLEKYAKIVNFSKFSLEISLKFSKISQNFQKSEVFVQTREILTHGLLNLLKNMQLHFFLIFFRNFFANFRKFSGVREAPPPGPPTRPAITLNPPKIFPAYATASVVYLYILCHFRKVVTSLR